MTSQQMFQWLNQNVYSGCAGDMTNPICKAVNTAAQQSGATLKTLADQLYKIKESDMVNWLQGPGQAQAQAIGNTLLVFLKCFLAPSDSARKNTVKGEVDAIARIKNWYLENYLQYFGKASIPGVGFTRADARNIRENVDRMLCKDKDVGLTILFWSVLVGVVMLVVGWLIGHARGKTACAKSIRAAAQRAIGK